MKKLILVLMIMAWSSNAFGATEGNCGPRSGSGTDESPYVFADNCKYKMENGVLTITGSGQMGDMCMNGRCQPWKGEDRGSVTKIVISEGITSIGSSAFVDFSKLTDVEIPKTVQSIGNMVFAYASFPPSGSENSIIIPQGVQTLFASIFPYNTKKIVIPDSVTTIHGECCGGAKTSNVTDITVSAENLQRYLDAGGKFGQDLALNCTSGDCMTLLAKWDEDHNTNYSANAKILLKSADGSTSIYKNGQLIGLKGKRIYTVQEAEMLAKPKGNKVNIRYK